MKNLITALFLSLFITTPAMAGGGHSHTPDGGHSHGPVSSDEAMSRADKKVHQLATKGVIDASWSGVQATSAEQKTFAKDVEWVIVFKNDKLKDPTKQTLYLFFSLDGYYIAANYSGK